jgi:S-formylglutathione hydrolase
MELTLLTESRCFGGLQQRYRHYSRALHCEMTFSIYLPPKALEGENVPAIYWLSGLTCTDENFMQKAGAQRGAAELGLALVASDTSPRGDHVPDDPDGSWDFGHGAGFYVDATCAPWSRNYYMHSYVVQELPDLVERSFSIDPERRGISGHSMGGHGALVAALRHPDRYRSVSAFSPIANPSACQWGQKAFGYLLGDNTSWGDWEAAALISQSTTSPSWSRHGPLLVDQGSADPFLEDQLKPNALKAAAEESKLPLELRVQVGYDHSYFFVASFLDDHLKHHAALLGSQR